MKNVRVLPNKNTLGEVLKTTSSAMMIVEKYDFSSERANFCSLQVFAGGLGCLQRIV